MRGRVVGAVVGVLVLAGCSPGEPEASVTVGAGPTVTEASAEVFLPEATADASVEPSPEPSLVPPSMPEAAREQSPEGAVAFTYWWFDLLNYATQTGDTEALRAASGPECGTCANFADEIDGAYQLGGRIEGGLFSVSVSPPGALQELGIRLAIIGDVEKTEYLNPSGKVTQTLAAEQTPITFSALLSSSGWVAGGLAGPEE